MAKRKEQKILFTGEFNPQNILKGIQQIQNQLNNSNINSDITKGYSTQLTALEKKTTNILSRINKGFSSKAEINAYEKEVTDVFTQFSSLVDKLKNQKIDFNDIILTNDLKQNFDNLKKNIENYKKELESLLEQRTQKIQNTNILSTEEQKKINKTLNIKDTTERNSQLTIERRGIENKIDSTTNALNIEKDKLDKLISSFNEATEAKKKFFEDKDYTNADEAYNNQLKKLEQIRDLVNKSKEGGHNPINTDLQIRGGYNKDFKYKNENGKEITITQEEYKKELALLKELEEAKKRQKSIESDISGIDKQRKESEELVKTHTEELEKLKNIKALYDVLSGDTSELSDDAKIVLQELINWNNEVKEATNNLQSAEKEMGDIKEKAKQVAEEDIDEMANGADRLKEETQKAVKETDNLYNSWDRVESETAFFDQLQNRIGMVLDLGSAFNYAQRAISFTFDTIKELDAAFTEIAVVTNQTNEQLWDSFDAYNDMAQKLGITTRDAIKTSALYYQQGLETADVMELTEETIKMARIAGMDFADATDRMTAAIRGFKLEMQDASRVNDVFSALAAESAVDTDELSYALTKTASIAASAGMELETTSAFLSQMIETTREAPENIGTAMKTIIARFQELKKNVGEIEVDGEIVDVNKIDTALKSVGVALRDDVTGQFRDLDDVFLELSQKWDTLDRNTQRYVATVAAGSRQQSRFLAMMDNYERTVELVNIANDSAGASSAQFDKTLGSIDSKINKIKASGEEIVGNLVDNQFVKDTLDFANKIMQVFAKISEQGPIAMVAFGIAAYKVVRNIFDGFQSGLKITANEYDKLNKKIKKGIKGEIVHVHKHVDQNGNPCDENGNPINNISTMPSGKEKSNNSTPTSTASKGIFGLSQSEGKILKTGKDGVAKDITKGFNTVTQISKTLGSVLSVVSLISTQTSSGITGSAIGQGIGSIAGSLTSFIPAVGPLIAPIVGPLASGIGGLIGGAIGDAIDRSKGVLSETYQKTVDNLKEELNQQKIDFDEENSSFLELAEEFNNLNSKTELTVEESQRLAEINEELAKIDKDFVSVRDNEGKILSINSSALDERIKKLREESALLEGMSKGADLAQEIINVEKEREKEKEKLQEDLTISTGNTGIIKETAWIEMDALYTQITGEDFLDPEGTAYEAIREEGDFSELEQIFSEIDRNNLTAEQESLLDEALTRIANDISGLSEHQNRIDEYNSTKEEFDSRIQDAASKTNDMAVSNIISDSDSDLSSNYSDLIQIYADSNDEVSRLREELITKLKNGEISADPTSKLYSGYEELTKKINTESQNSAGKIINDLNNLDESQLESLSRASALKGLISKEDIEVYLENSGFSEEFIKAFVQSIGDSAPEELGKMSSGMQEHIQNMFSEGQTEEAGKLAFTVAEWEEGNKDLDIYREKLEYLKEEFGENSVAVNLFKEYAQDSLSSFGYTLEQTSKRVEGLNTRIKSLQSMETAAIQGTLSIEQMNTLIDKYGLSNNNFEQTADGLKLVGISIQEIIDKEEELAKIDAFERLNAQIGIYNSLGAASTKEAFGKTTAVLVDGNIKFYKTAKDIVEALEKNEITMDDLTEEEKEFISATVEAKNGVSALNKEIKGLNEATKNNYFGPFIDGLKSIDNLSSKIQIGSNAIKEFNENGQISLDTALGLISANEDYVQAIEVKNGILTLNKEKIQDIANSEKEALKQEFTFSKKRIEAENNVLNNLIIAEREKITTVEQSLTNKVNTYEDFDKVLVSVEESYNNALLKEEQTLQGAIGEKIAEGADDQLGILSERAKEEAKIIEEMASNWEKYYAASNGEDVEINTNIKTPKEILSTFKFDKNYYKTYAEKITDYSTYFKKTFGENMTEDMLYSTYGADFVAHIKEEIRTSTNNGVTEAVAVQQTLLKIKADAEARLEQLINKHTGNKKMIDYYGKQIELLDNFNFLSTGGKSESSKSDDQKEYNLELDKFYNILSKIAQAQRDINELDRERENYSNYKELAKIDAKRLSASKMLEEHYRTLLNMQKKERKNLENQLAQYSKYVTVRDGYLQVNHDTIAGITDEEFGNTLKDLIDSYDDLSQSIEDTNNNLQEQEENQKKIIDSGREYAQTLKDKLLQMVIEAHEEEIQAVKDKYEAIKEADNNYLSTLKENIQKQRDLRDQKNEEEELSKMEKRLALLRRDTSGIYASEIIQLEEEIAQKRQDMADQQQDEMIQEIEDEQNARHKGMDQETEFLDAQHQENLESMTAYWAEVEEIMKGGYDNILSYLKDNNEEFITGSEESQISWLDTWKKNIDEALAYRKLLTDNPEVADSESNTKIGIGKSSATDTTKQQEQEKSKGSEKPKQEPKKPEESNKSEEPKKTKPENGEIVTLEKGKKLYSGTGDTKGTNSIFGAGPYVVLKTSGNRVQVRYKGAKSGVSGWLNISDLVGYSTGGYVTETGPVMVHGSKNKPEAFLSANDTKLIEGMRDALRYISKQNGSAANTIISEKTGDVYYEIHIEVDELNSDYSVNEMMAAIEKKIVSDARGRNVIAIKRNR